MGPLARSTPAQTVLVAGASGFIGSAVVTALVDAGYRVRALVRRSESADQLTRRFGDAIDVAVGDLESGDGLAALTRGLVSPVPLIVASGRSSTKAGAKGRAGYESIHIRGTENLLEACGSRT
jgi:NADH dehydrogenase